MALEILRIFLENVNYCYMVKPIITSRLMSVRQLYHIVWIDWVSVVKSGGLLSPNKLHNHQCFSEVNQYFRRAFDQWYILYGRFGLMLFMFCLYSIFPILKYMDAILWLNENIYMYQIKRKETWKTKHKPYIFKSRMQLVHETYVSRGHC